MTNHRSPCIFHLKAELCNHLGHLFRGLLGEVAMSANGIKLGLAWNELKIHNGCIIYLILGIISHDIMIITYIIHIYT